MKGPDPPERLPVPDHSLTGSGSSCGPCAGIPDKGTGATGGDVAGAGIGGADDDDGDGDGDGVGTGGVVAGRAAGLGGGTSTATRNPLSALRERGSFR